MGDEDGVDQVKEQDDGAVALGGGRTCIYMGDVDGVGQVKKEGKAIKLGGGRTHASTSVSHACARRARGLVVSASKPLEDGLMVWVSKPSTASLTGLGLKTGE